MIRRDDGRCGACVVAVVAVLAACESGDTPNAAVETTTPGTVGVPTLPGFDVPQPCTGEAESLSVWTAGVRIDPRAGTAGGVIRIENLSDEACEVQLTDELAARSVVEPTVVVDPGMWAELVVGGGESACARPQPVAAVELTLNGVERAVATTAVACEPALLEFLPTERPQENCASDDIATAHVAGGIAVRNNGFRGCVLGELVEADQRGSSRAIALEHVDPAAAPEAGEAVTALAPGDVVWFPTIVRPGDVCPDALGGVVLTFTSGATADALIGVCDSVVLGPGHGFYGSAASPLLGWEDIDGAPHERVRSLDPFGDPCQTVPVAPAALVTGEPIVSPAVITGGDDGRLATWGTSAAGGVTQILDVLIRDDSFIGVPAARLVTGVHGDAAVVPGDPDRIIIDIADESCVRRYVVGQGVDLEQAIEAATRWVGG